MNQRNPLYGHILDCLSPCHALVWMLPLLPALYSVPGQKCNLLTEVSAVFHFFLVYTWCHFFLCRFFLVPFFLCHFFLCLFLRCHLFRLPTVTPICTGVGTGGGARGACAPHFSEWRAKICLCPPPLSDPEFRDVPPPFCHVPTPLIWYI